MKSKIDWSNPITNNLKRFCVFYSGNVCWDAVTRTFGVPNSNYGSHVITPYGVALNSLDATGTQAPEWAGEFALIGGSSGLPTLGHTGMFLARSNKAGSRATQEFLGGSEGSGASGDIWNSRILAGGSPNYTVYESDSPIGSNGTYPTGKDSQDWLFYGGTYNVADNEIICRVSSNPYDMAVDSTPASVSVAVDPGNSSTLFTVGSLGTSSNSWDGDIVFAAEWLRPLSEGEWNSMVANPWQVFKPQTLFAHTQDYFPIDVQAGASSGDILEITLVDAAGSTLNNLTGISWAWFDQSTVNSASTPTATGTGATTNASGLLSLDITGTALTSGQTGMLALQDSTGYIYAWYRVTL